MSASPATTFVVVNWNRRALLEECLRALQAQTRADFELVLVDNGSTDGSPECLGEFPRLRAALIRNQENRGFAPAVNQGIRAARGRFIALLNNDAVLDSRWLEAMLAPLETNPELGMCACKIVFAGSAGIIDKAGHVIAGDGQNYGRGHREPDRGQYDLGGEVLFPDGAAALFRREVFESAGLFDEDFFAYGDDAEMGLRARLCGWKCLYVPTAIAYHHHSATLGAYSPQKIFLVERNRVWLVAKLFPLRALLQVPCYTAARWLYSMASLIMGRGDAARARGETSLPALLGAVLRAQVAALSGLPAILRKRREFRRRCRVSSREFARLMKRYSISVRKLSL
jgi:GT2 family glycosyltransferase